VSRSVVWFRRDLRLADHPALTRAAQAGDVVPVFVVDPAFARSGAPRWAFLAGALRALDESMGGALVVRGGDPVRVVPALAAEVGADRVVVTEDHGPYGRRRDDAVAAALARDGRPLRGVGTSYAVAPGRTRKADGTPFAVFTPFSRAWAALGWEAPLPVPDVRWVGRAEVPSDPLPEVVPPAMELPEPGERPAHRLLEAFLGGPLAQYGEQRDRPGVPGTSRLSPYLRWGNLHPRQVLTHLGDEPSHRKFRAEIAWREFYADVLFHRPRSAWEDLQPKMARVPVDTDAAAQERFAAWQEGRTGYPIVDAGMRQLAATGWMHNRVRMIVASFLVKDLHLPWQWGARHFLDLLVDGDLASNSHGWQWTAGTGTDAAPYFRVFNPTSQARKFDPDGAYVRRWVPELAHLADADVHDPPPALRPATYPASIVDHATERAEALRRYALVTGAG
jgi:deoxyribodipyrimidine photo-lyase